MPIGRRQRKGRGRGGGGGGGSGSTSSLLQARLHEQHALLLEAQAQARRAEAAYRRVRGAHRMWLAAQLVVPLLGALAVGVALGGRTTRARAR